MVLPSRPIMLLVLVCSGTATFADFKITVKNSFIGRYKRRATISGSFLTDHAHPSPNGIADDGDMHIAGRCDTVGLPMVAEIMMAADFPDALAAVHLLEGTGMRAPITGVWRLWFEHPGGIQVQGNTVPVPHNTNPDHVFEIHPVTSFNGVSVLDSFKPIKRGDKEFKYKVAKKAFDALERTAFEIITHKTTTDMISSKVGNNYIRFKIKKLEEKVFDVVDGAVVFASCLDLQGQQLLRKRRLVLVKGTEPERVIRDLPKGQPLEVIAIPRVSLSLVAWRMSHPASLKWKLPYELVIVAVNP